MLRVATFTGDTSEPSSRYRIRQYIDFLTNNGIQTDDFFSLEGRYPPINNRLIWGMKILTERVRQLVKVNSGHYDCVILQREMISTLNTFENLITKPKILDVDDAIYLYRNGRFIKRISEKSDAIICGNTNLANVFERWNKQIYILPTAVDTTRYFLKQRQSKEKITLGWIGTSGGFKYLYKIEKALDYLLTKYKNVELLIVSNTAPDFRFIKNYRFLKWNEKTEVDHFHTIDIGLMPLIDDEWSRGKCSYKMLLYLSCGSPVVVSPVGMNQEVLQKDKVGFGAKDYYSDWIESIEFLIENQTSRTEMGQLGHKVIQDHYSLEVLSKQMSEIIKTTARK